MWGNRQDMGESPSTQACLRDCVQFVQWHGCGCKYPRRTENLPHFLVLPIEHMVAASEAHDSGLCARDRATRARFASDLRNLTLAAPHVNRNQKGGKDAAEWLPERNRCWFAARVVEVRRAYELTIDRREAAALERVLSGCESYEMEPMVCNRVRAGREDGSVSGGEDVLRLYDDNGDGRIWCSEARRHGIAPVAREHPAYRYMRDGDSDGVVCE